MYEQLLLGPRFRNRLGGSQRPRHPPPSMEKDILVSQGSVLYEKILKFYIQTGLKI